MSEEKEKSLFFGDVYDFFFGRPVPMWLGSVLIAGMSVGLFVLAQPFGASCAIVNWGRNIYGWNVANGGTFPNTVEFKCAMGCIVLIIGAMAAAFLAKEWAFRIAPPGELVKGIIGGLFMAFGAVIGKGCTLGSFFSGWASLSGGALVFGFGLMIGAFLGAKWLLFEMERWPGISDGTKAKTFDIPKNIQPWIGLVLLVLALAFPLFFGYETGALGGEGFDNINDAIKTDRIIVGFMTISVFIGIMLQRSRWCVVRAMREPWMSGTSEPMKAILAGILVGMIGISAYKFSYGSAAIAGVFVFPHFWIRALIGATLFGFGMTIAGGCAVGSMWRAAEGQVKLMLSLLTMIFTMPLVAKYIMGKDAEGNPVALLKWFKSFESGALEQVYLPDKLGSYGAAIGVVLLCMAVLYLFTSWNDRTGKFAAM